jgi:hypothetical protein
MSTNSPITFPAEQRGPAEQLLDLVLTSSAHLWHSRPGKNVDGKWVSPQRKGSGAANIG